MAKKLTARLQRVERCPECHSIDLFVNPQGYATCEHCGHDCDRAEQFGMHIERFAEEYEYALPVESR